MVGCGGLDFRVGLLASGYAGGDSDTSFCFSLLLSKSLQALARLVLTHVFAGGSCKARAFVAMACQAPRSEIPTTPPRALRHPLNQTRHHEAGVFLGLWNSLSRRGHPLAQGLKAWLKGVVESHTIVPERRR